MQGFKNVLARQLLNDDSVQPLVKKSQQHRRIIQICLQHFLQIYKNIQSFSQYFQGQIFELHHQLTQTQNKLPLYFIQLSQLFKNINVQLKIFSQKSNGSYKQLNQLCNTLFFQYSNNILNFQQHIRNYQSIQLIVLQMSKKYYRSFKNMVGYLQSYKSSFTDARLIYNIQEKVKRYQLCQSTYKSLQDDLKSIQQKCDKLSQKKTAIKQNYLSIEKEMNKTIKMMANKSINEIKCFVKNYSQYQKTIVTFLAEKKFTLEKLSITTIFESIENQKCGQYFNCQINKEQCLIFPAIFVYIQQIKTEYIPYCKTAFINYLKESSQKIQKRKQVNKQILQFIKLYTLGIQKYQYNNLKQIVGNFEKIKKKLSQLFSNRFVSFIKSIHSIFQLSIGILTFLYSGINEKLLKSFNNKLKNIQTYITQQNKHMDMFLKQLKSNIQKFISKRQPKKSLNQAPTIIKQPNPDTARSNDMNKSALFIQDSFIVVDNTQFRKQIKQRSQFLIHLIQGFIYKFQSNQKLLKSNINSIVNDYSQSINEFYSLCCQYQTIYFGDQQFLNNFKKYQLDIDKTLQKQTQFIHNQLGFKSLLQQTQQQQKIIFDGEIQKVQEFKKLKKPTGLDNNDLSQSKKNIPEPLLRKSSSTFSDKKQSTTLSQIPLQQQSGSKTPPTTNGQNSSLKESTGSMKDSGVLSNTSQISKQQKTYKCINNSTQKSSQKYFQLLSKKVKFEQGQQYIKSFSCAFYDKIILQGRIFITNKRLCFHSKFNPTNIFFGGTFIEIPKKDITKVQKRYNALIFDNSIAITTVNGQMFFTSFFSRDQAFDLINKALQLNVQQQFFQPEEQSQQKNQQQNVESQQIIQQQDDLKSQNQNGRQEEATKLLQSFPYQTLLQGQYQVPKITAMKFFRLFDSGQQIHLNRRTYKSFLQYCKDLIGHKEIQIHHFKPNILQYLNFNNIKNNTPIKIQRKLNAMVPISAAGVPFMPKAARSDEIQALYFISKNKYIIQSTIQNSGAPYTDCFNVKIKRTVESIQQNKIRFKAEMHVNFVKSTMMKSMIQSKAFQQTKVYFVKMQQQIKKYFKGLQKTKKVDKGKKGEQKQQVNNEQVQTIKKQLQTSLEQKDKLEQKVKILQSKQKNIKQYLFISVILNIFLILLLIS